MRFYTVCFRGTGNALAAVGLGVAMALSAWSQTQTQTVHVVVQADRPGARISPTLYGAFFEEISMAGDGGLYAELIRNRSFEDADSPSPWSIVDGGEAPVDLAVDEAQPVSVKNLHSLKVAISGSVVTRAGIANSGYWGLPVAKNESYRLSLHVRAAASFEGPLTATLESTGGVVYARAKIEGLTAAWQAYEFVLTSEATDPQARLAITADRLGTFWLDGVSLFPSKTWKGRTNGLRTDLAEMLAGLRPGMLRFPGGCWVEGDTPEQAVRWKTTIGDLLERRTQWNTWKYSVGNGLGYYEYLLLCEDLGAEPLFVINCGISHGGSVPLDRLGEWVQDALDAIEYANGPTNSVWGSLRAKAGHPAPFHLKYIEIGNENFYQHADYQARYPFFYDAIRARYPDMVIVANERMDTRPADIIDEHFYSSPEFFIEHATLYDDYDRQAPKIYVGEYAVTDCCGAKKLRGDMRAAVGEAAFLTGLERNADAVVMSSYAPLFANVHCKRWDPDLINFDASRVYALPSYYMQKMFGENRGDVVLPVTVEVPPPADAPKPCPGSIGVGTWGTQAEFKDIVVTDNGQTLFRSDAVRDLAGWRPEGGAWSVRDGALRQTSTERNCRLVLEKLNRNDYTLSMKARKLDGAEGFLILFRVRDNGAWTWWNLGGWGNQRHGVERCADGVKTSVGSGVRGRIETGRWYDIRLEAQGDRVRCFLDGKRVHDLSLSQGAPPVCAAASRVEASRDVVLKLVNTAFVSCEAEIDVRGVRRLGPTVRATTLSSSRATDENSLEEPFKVIPRSFDFAVASPRFHTLLPANSVTVLRLTAE